VHTFSITRAAFTNRPPWLAKAAAQNGILVKRFFQISQVFLYFFQLNGGGLPGWALKETAPQSPDGVGQGAAWCTSGFGIAQISAKSVLGVGQ